MVYYLLPLTLCVPPILIGFKAGLKSGNYLKVYRLEQ